MSTTSAPTDLIAIVGLSARAASCPSIDSLWSAFVQGESLLPSARDLTPLELSYGNSRSEADLKATTNFRPVRGSIPQADVEQFDAELFSMSGVEARHTDPQQRLLLSAAHEALERAGINPDSDQCIPGREIGCFATGLRSSYTQRLQGLIDSCVVPPPNDLNWAPRPQLHYSIELSNTADVMASKIAYKLNLRGPSYTTLGSCAGGGVVLHTAVRALLAGDCETAVVGSSVVRTSANLLASGYFYEPGLIMSEGGACYPISSHRDGTILSDGVTALVLKRLSAAERDGNPILAVIRGTAVTNDGSGGLTPSSHKSSIFSPNIDGQQRCVEAALLRAGVHPNSLSFIECHATGTRMGDPVEIQAIYNAISTRRAFDPSIPSTSKIVLGALKGIVGHTEGNAGLLSVAKVAMCFLYDVLPPHVRTPAEKQKAALDASDPLHGILSHSKDTFHLNETPIPFPQRNGVEHRYAAVNVYGLGGVNAHAVFQDYHIPNKSIGSTTVASTGLPFVVHLSAASSHALQRLLVKWLEFAQQLPELLSIASTSTQPDVLAKLLWGVAYSIRRGLLNFRNIAYTSSTRRALPYRFALALQDDAGVVEAMRTQLSDALDQLEGDSNPPRVISTSPPQVVFVCPGQGSFDFEAMKSFMQSSPLYARTLRKGFALAAKFIAHLQSIYPFPVASSSSSSTGEEIAVLCPYVDLPDERALLEDSTSPIAQQQLCFYAQLYIFLHSVCIGLVWNRLLADTNQVAILYGHSVGEIAATALGGLLTFTESIGLVCARLWCMNRAPAGEMVVCRASLVELQTRIKPLLTEDEILAVNIAATNAPDQTVLSGDILPMGEIKKRMRSLIPPIQFKEMASTQAFHSHMLDPLMDQFAKYFETVMDQAANIAKFSRSEDEVELCAWSSSPRVVFSTLTKSPLDASAVRTSTHWALQFRGRVSFDLTTQAVESHFHRIQQRYVAIEIGHGNTTTGLMTKIVRALSTNLSSSGSSGNVDTDQDVCKSRRHSSRSNAIVSEDHEEEEDAVHVHHGDRIPISQLLLVAVPSTRKGFTTILLSFADALASVWAHQVELAFDRVYSGELLSHLNDKPNHGMAKLMKIPCLPTYAFAKTAFWMNPTAAVAQHVTSPSSALSAAALAPAGPSSLNLVVATSSKSFQPSRASVLIDIIRQCMANVIMVDVAQLTATSDFIQLGGDSFSAISFASQLNRALQAAYPIAVQKKLVIQPTTFARHTTIGGIVRHILQQLPDAFLDNAPRSVIPQIALKAPQTDNAPDAVAPTFALGSLESLFSILPSVPIQLAGPQVESPKVRSSTHDDVAMGSDVATAAPTRWFCAPPVGGMALDLRDLGGALAQGEANLEVFVLQHPTPAVSSFEAASAQRFSVQQLADVYRAQILSVQPSGPFRLLGVSFGGLICWQLAQDLVAAGHTVAQLVQLDTPLPAVSKVAQFMFDRASMLYFVASMKTNGVSNVNSASSPTPPLPTSLISLDAIRSLQLTQPSQLFSLAKLLQLLPSSAMSIETSPNWSPLMEYLNILHADMHALMAFDAAATLEATRGRSWNGAHIERILYLTAGQPAPFDPVGGSEVWHPLHSAVSKETGEDSISTLLHYETIPCSHSQLHRQPFADQVVNVIRKWARLEPTTISKPHT